MRWTEKKDGSNRAEWQMTNFKEAVDVCGFREVSFRVTSSHMIMVERGDNIQCRLHRALATSSCMDMFSTSHLFHLDREWSDHASIKLILWHRDSGVVLGEKLFRFEQFWAKEDECEYVIANAWLGGSALALKLELCAAD